MAASRVGWRLAPALAGVASLVVLAALLARALSPVTVPAPPPSTGGPPPGGRWLPTSLRTATDTLLLDPARHGVLLAGGAGGVWRSADGGATWQHTSGHLPAGVEIYALAAGGGGAVVAGGLDGSVYLSTTAARDDWQRIGAWGADRPIFSVALGGSDGRTALAGTFGALYQGRREAGRWRWRRAATAPNDAAITSLAWAPGSATVAYAGVFVNPPPVLISRDGGTHWQADQKGLPSEMPVQMLLPVGGPAPRIILSTMGSGVWQRAVAEHGWDDISTGLPLRHAMAMTALPSGARGTVLYAGTMGNGVFVRTGAGPWQPLGSGLRGAAYSVLSLAVTGAPTPRLFAATVRGLYHYAAPGTGTRRAGGQ